nr:ATP-binding protein [Pseudenhygromyxa sp. WMMC2535]
MAFFRELIQNALDAGSEEVEIRFDYREGKMVIHVDDWGAGMNREIIDTRLTRLFSSSKDGDRTKIGKFGIGFVSVFAIQPEAVCIDTSRDGENWRIVFDAERRFSLVRREAPTEGTQIQIFKALSPSEYADFRARAREVVGYWCKHVSGEVRVEGELINEPFELGAPLEVRQQGGAGGGSESGSGDSDELVVVGHLADRGSFAGFYNRGLTLIEQEMIPGLAFKASSAKLEHTLTRDDVIRDQGFDRLMAQVHALVAGELCERVFAEIDAAVRLLDPSAGLDDASTERLEYLWAAAAWHEQAEHALPESVAERALFRSPAGRLISLANLRRARRSAAKRPVLASAPSELSEAMERAGYLVLWLPPTCAAGWTLADRVGRGSLNIDAWCTATPARDSEEALRWQPLTAAVARLLDGWGAKVHGVHLGHLHNPDPALRERVAITQAEFGELTLVAEASALGTGLLSTRRALVLNADHPTIRGFAELARSEPELAAYFTVKAFFLGERLDARTDEALVQLTHDARSLRTA